MHDALQIIALSRVAGNLLHRNFLSRARKKCPRRGKKKTATKSSKGDKEEEEEEEVQEGEA